MSPIMIKSQSNEILVAKFLTPPSGIGNSFSSLVYTSLNDQKTSVRSVNCLNSWLQTNLPRYELTQVTGRLQFSTRHNFTFPCQYQYKLSALKQKPFSSYPPAHLLLVSTLMVQTAKQFLNCISEEVVCRVTSLISLITWFSLNFSTASKFVN